MAGMEVSAERLVLVVDDNSSHVQVVEQVLAEKHVRLVAIANGSQALDYLHRRGTYSQALRPDLILLDLNLSAQNGYEILATLKADQQLRRIPIVVLTASDNPENILRSYALQGNCYVVKALDLDHLAQTIQKIEDFWLGIVTLPLE